MYEKVQIGRATLYHGNALEVLQDLPAASVSDVLTDPPYSSGGTFSSSRTAPTSQKYCNGTDFSGDNKDQRSYAFWSALWLSECHRITVPGGLCVMFTDWRQLPVSTDFIQAGGWVWRGIGVWDKLNARPQLGRYRQQAEFFVWSTRGPRPISGAISPGVYACGATSEPRLHMAAKPVHLLSDLLAPCGNTILDPFMGSASAGVAALRSGRDYIGIEIDRHAFDISCERLAAIAAGS